MTVDGEVGRHSTSSHGSDLSATVYNPNSSQNTPTVPVFSTGAVNRTGTSSVGGDEGGDEDEDEDEDDEEKIPKLPVEGWPQVALLMAKTPDFAAFSRFRDLNIKSLLYYQAQLTTLREKLHKQEYADSRSLDKDGVAMFAKRADFLMSAEDSEQFKLIKKIREVLKDYNEALLQYSQISALPEPDTYNMKNLTKWLRHPKTGKFSIGGNGEQNTWGDMYKDPDAGQPSLWGQFWILLWAFIWPQAPPENDLDLVVTRPQAKIDGFTRWVAWYLIPFSKALRQHREQIKEDKRNKRTQSDLEKDTNGSNSIPFYRDMRRYRENGKEEKLKKQIQSSGETPLPPEEWAEEVKRQKTIETVSDNSMLKFTSGISTVIACLLPVVAITVLSQVSGTRNLLLCLAGFAVIFAVGLIFLTSGTSSRVEIFTATAAFSAVLVVFISVPVVIIPSPASPPPFP